MWDGLVDCRVIRAFTPVCDGLCPAMTAWRRAARAALLTMRDRLTPRSSCPRCGPRRCRRLRAAI
ncbi:hypothetical protein DW352_20885 [Pseudolabrys taiwanensis]|uniref:Uncharacterized protein n=1 Tax=Pseudolabrys taiwanensis TaxID=331696 RepID=A0A346A0R5_9HYPH|nr:hypothetical protein DW352_20885 [Pseudolabrys taiwanensis]